jgi:chromosome segregation ATPase
LALTIVIFAMLCYTIYDLKASKEANQFAMEQQTKRMESIKDALSQRLTAADTHLAELKTDLNTIQKRVGVTQKELNQARAQAQQLRQEQEKTKEQLSRQLQEKADSSQLSALQHESENKIGAVSSDVATVKTELSATRKEVETARREIVDARDYLSQQIAHNREELNTLRRKGERDYIEFDINRKNSARPVGDIYLTLKKADPKKRKYDMVIAADDNQLEKKQRTLNEPVQFLVGKSRLRYELVVYQIGKDRITGYLSVPKDRALSAERP